MLSMIKKFMQPSIGLTTNIVPRAAVAFSSLLAPKEANMLVIERLIKRLSHPNISFYEAQKLVKKITMLLLINNSKFSKKDSQKIVLLPVLRAGIPMWIAANQYFEGPESSFLICYKKKGSTEVCVIWPLKPDLKGKKILILDTIIATGDTISALIQAIASDKAVCSGSISVMACYASPEALGRIKKIVM